MRVRTRYAGLALFVVAVLLAVGYHLMSRAPKVRYVMNDAALSGLNAVYD